MFRLRVVSVVSENNPAAPGGAASSISPGAMFRPGVIVQLYEQSGLMVSWP
jgi:hypothetical protein